MVVVVVVIVVVGDYLIIELRIRVAMTTSTFNTSIIILFLVSLLLTAPDVFPHSIRMLCRHLARACGAVGGHPSPEGYEVFLLPDHGRYVDPLYPILASGDLFVGLWVIRHFL